MDKKTIINALKRCVDETPEHCKWCPYNKGSAQCISDLMRDALALIGILEVDGGVSMADEYIRKQDAVDAIKKRFGCNAVSSIIAESVIDELEPADVVSVSAYKQVMWERDVAVEQLKQIGKGLGEVMDDAALVAHGWRQK